MLNWCQTWFIAQNLDEHWRCPVLGHDIHRGAARWRWPLGPGGRAVQKHPEIVGWFVNPMSFGLAVSYS